MQEMLAEINHYLLFIDEYDLKMSQSINRRDYFNDASSVVYSSQVGHMHCQLIRAASICFKTYMSFIGFLELQALAYG